MKKQLLLAAFLITLSFSLRAQSLYFLGGMTYTHMNWEGYPVSPVISLFYPNAVQKVDQQWGTGYCFFVGKEYLNWRAFSLTSEIGLIHNEAKYRSTERMDFLGFNTMANLSLFDKFRVYLQAGPKLDYLFDHTLMYPGAKLYTLNLGAIGGAGFKWYVTDAVFLGLNARYGIYFNKMIHDGAGGDARPEQFHFNFMAGVDLWELN